LPRPSRTGGRGGRADVGLLRRPRRRPHPRPLRLLQTPRGPGRSRRPAQGPAGRVVRVAAVQHDVAWEDREATLARLEPQLKAAAGAGARLVVLTEMFPIGFSMEPERLAEPEDGPSAGFLRTQAGQLGVWLAGSVPIRPDGGGRPVNRLLLAGPGGELEHYDKLHPFTYSGEHEHYAPGSRRVTV